MKHMQKAVSLIILCALICVFTAGCHGSRRIAAFAIPESFDMEREYEITFWAKSDTNINQTRTYEQAISAFQEIYPNITVNLKIYTDYGRIYNDVITNIATNTTPNVCITYPDHIATYLTGPNSVVPLDDLFADEKYGLGGSEVLFDSVTADEIVPQFLSECVIDGVHYALPYMRSTEACYVNKTYVEALGFTLPEVLTWDFVWEVSEAAMAQDEAGNYIVNGQSVMIPFIYKSTDNMMIQMLRQLDAGYSTGEGDVLLFNDTTRELLDTVAFHAETGAFSTFKISGYPANYLNKGQCIFAVDSTAGATWMGCDAPLSDISEEDIVEFETVLMPIPQYDPENLVMISQGPSVCVFNHGDPQEVMASWLFTQFLLTNDVQISYARTEGYVPVTTRAQESEAYQEYLSRKGEDNKDYYPIKIDAAELLVENTENTFVTPVFNGSASLRNAAGQLIESVVKSINRKQTVDDEYYETLYAEMTSLYRLDQIGASVNVSAEKAELGPLPKTSVILLSVLGGTWVLIGLYVVLDGVKKKNFKKNPKKH